MIKTIITFLLSLSILSTPFLHQDQSAGFTPEEAAYMSQTLSKPEAHALKIPPFSKSFLHQPGKAANVYTQSITHFIPQPEVRHGDLLLEKTCAIPVKYQSNYLS
ncbi:hypothetical protein [Bacillus sonorensis]|uniref:hypothetical protein n=1 Tax=Bacillus sonorensis TaxID=119858 RepID=UPI002281B216|nr:hypothetical protein [Bacillus sonorensis]